MSFIGDLLRAGIETDGMAVRIPGLAKNIGRGKTFYVDGANGTAGAVASSPKSAGTTINAVKAKMTTGVNDRLALLSSVTSVKIAAATDWSLNCSHLIGEGGYGRMNMRSRIEQNAVLSPFFKVSGYGNTFANLYFMQGTSSASNLVGLSITGQRNTFYNVHVLPQDATAADQATFRLVSIDQSETYFGKCFFGGDGIAWTNGAMVQIGATSDGGPPRTVFEDCIFLMNADNAQVAFLDCALAGLGGGAAIFLNCQFLNIGSSLTYAILGAGLNNFKLYFDNRCSFAGVTDIVAATYESYVWFGGVNMPINQVNTASVALFNGLACHPDVS